jgi:two-component system, OmpR family, response regulator
MTTKPLERVCYVEDDEDIQRIVRMSLERVGKMTVKIVGDPLVAVDAIVEFKPDLVLLDWMMPGMDGPTLFKRLRENPQTENLPVVFMTAKATPGEMEELRSLGVLGAISKPFSPKDLPEQLKALWNTLP